MKASNSLKGGFYLVTMATGRESHPHPSLSLCRDTKGKGDQREAAWWGGCLGVGGGGALGFEWVHNAIIFFFFFSNFSKRRFP